MLKAEEVGGGALPDLSPSVQVPGGSGRRGTHTEGKGLRVLTESHPLHPYLGPEAGPDHEGGTGAVAGLLAAVHPHLPASTAHPGLTHHRAPAPLHLPLRGFCHLPCGHREPGWPGEAMPDGGPFTWELGRQGSGEG